MARPRVLLVTAGSHGDVFPFLGLGRALSRDADVAVLVNPYFEDDVAAAGLDFRPLGEHIDLPAFIRDERIMEGDRGSARVMRLVFENIGLGLDALGRELDAFRPDVVVSHHICVGVRWLLTARDVPHAFVTLSPMIWFSQRDEVPLMQKEQGRLRSLGARVGARVGFPVIRRLASVHVNRHRRRHGYPSEPDAFVRDWHGGRINLGLWSRHFRDAMPDDPPHASICGFPFYDGPQEVPVDPDVDRFLDDGDPPLIFSLGSTAVHVAGDFYRRAADACVALGRRGLLLMGDAAGGFRSPSPAILAARWAPLSKVAPRGAGTVVHGGIGSTSQALRAGRPSLIVPFAHDQFNNGLRVRHLGVGDVVSARRLERVSLEARLRALLDDEGVGRRARALGDSLRAEDGCTEAAGRALSLVATS